MERFSKWSRLKRSIGWPVRFIHNCKVGKERSNLKKGPLNLEEINDAVNLLMKQVQRGAYPEELATLRNHPLPIKNKLSSLCPFIDKDGLLRVGGSLKLADMPVEAKQPIILPKSHHVTKLIIRNDHEKKEHIGREHVLSNLCQLYWIVNARAAKKLVLYSCFSCRVRKSKQAHQLMADLPKGRLAHGEPPFSHCGVEKTFEKMGCDLYLFYYQMCAPRSGYKCQCGCIHQCTSKIRESKRSTIRYVLGLWYQLYRFAKGIKGFKGRSKS